MVLSDLINRVSRVTSVDDIFFVWLPVAARKSSTRADFAAVANPFVRRVAAIASNESVANPSGGRLVDNSTAIDGSTNGDSPYVISNPRSYPRTLGIARCESLGPLINRIPSAPLTMDPVRSVPNGEPSTSLAVRLIPVLGLVVSCAEEDSLSDSKEGVF